MLRLAASNCFVSRRATRSFFREAPAQSGAKRHGGRTPPPVCRGWMRNGLCRRGLIRLQWIGTTYTYVLVGTLSMSNIFFICCACDNTKLFSSVSTIIPIITYLSISTKTRQQVGTLSLARLACFLPPDVHMPVYRCVSIIFAPAHITALYHTATGECRRCDAVQGSSTQQCPAVLLALIEPPTRQVTGPRRAPRLS